MGMVLKEGYIGNWKNYPKDEVKILISCPSKRFRPFQGIIARF
jgi:hypothetical protein